ncbi:MAG: hypothetical protein COV45_05790 [Deltaproteobacteria bacterium CG11_big_fil_rev_8_21_14_0_20_47_16]|nr:MAG: hypothetical protein COV45_05790 [Deltaproteobacteria bacterium CG11_big_fil_rev_8_21_14_0_20_47_16]
MNSILFNFLNRDTPRLLKLTHRLVAAGIATAVAMLIVTIAIMQGFWGSYVSAARGFHGDMVILQDPEGIVSTDMLSEFRSDTHSSGIAAESPFIVREGLLTGGNGVNGVVVKGIDWDSFSRVHMGLLVRWDEGGDTKFLSPATTSALPVILGSALDATERPTHLFMPTKVHPEGESIPINVVGTFSSGLYDYDHQFILVPRHQLGALYHLPEKTVDGIALRLNNPDETWSLARRWQDQFLNVTVATWGELNYAMFDALRLQRTTFVVLMSLFVLIALSNVTGVVGLQVWFRRREAAILRLLGLSRSELRRLIWRSAIRTSIVGVTIGTSLALVIISWLRFSHFIELPASVYFVEQLPLQMKTLWVGVVVSGVLLAAATVTAIAVVRMAKLPILKGLVRI